MDGVDILDSRECKSCGMPMHMHPTTAGMQISTDGNGFCIGAPPESTPLPFTIAEFRDVDQLEWYEYLSEGPRGE